ncbi:hypothetical protein [Actinoplanes rectilineatus]|uniref:hypothetical protein n=1 Tax=Actinoplanes rectilineatus TaxID=113571 RepID=UPI000698FE04|nr:hypothetical protein [Actinoplanes rectilineatus]
MTWLVVAALLLVVVVLAVPSRRARERLAGRRPAIRFDVPRIRAGWIVAGPPWRAALGTAGVAAGPALLAGGPVGALVAATYAALAGRAWARRAEHRRRAAQRAGSLDALCALVADLRAGIPPSVVADGGGIHRDARLNRLTTAVWRLADQTGAPAADLLERIEADARAEDRAAASAAAQAAGTQATAAMLAVLPVGGIGLGYLIGADPVHVLLRTPLGAGCTVLAVLLQCCGLGWSEWIAQGAGR